jgi:hypothetical protein
MGVSLGTGVGTGVDVGKTVGGGAHAPRSVQTTNRAARSTLIGPIVFMAATLLKYVSVANRRIENQVVLPAERLPPGSICRNDTSFCSA